jgi:hypothetical protein
MVQDLSYINEQPSEAQETAVQQAVEKECLKAIQLYLTQIADTMDAQSIESLNVPTIRAMALEMETRVNNYGSEQTN